MIFSITLTGIDEQTDLDQLFALSWAANRLRTEWGVLYSPDRAGQDPRYPSVEWIRNLSRFAHERQQPIALHVCGRGVEAMLFDSELALRLTSGYGRVQLNFNQAKRKLGLHHLEQLISTLARPVITQYNDANEALSRLITSPYHQLLVDASGGRGISPERWPAPLPLKVTGYAGGLGPENLAEHLAKINAVAGPDAHRSWVDMESKLRTPANTFDYDRAFLAVSVLSAYVGGNTFDIETRTVGDPAVDSPTHFTVR